MSDEREIVEYQGKNWEVLSLGRTFRPGGVTLHLVPIPVLPPEPPIGTILVDDNDEVWQRTASYDGTASWATPGSTTELTWRDLLSGTDLRNVMVAGKATDSLVRLRNVAITHNPGPAPYEVYGFTDDEAPVHGYYKRIEQ